MSQSDTTVKNKGHIAEDPLVRYAYAHSVKLTDVQKKLVERTMQLSNSRYLSGPEEGQFFQQLLRLMKAKRTLDIGVYTSYSAMTVAMALPDNGKVVALDITDQYMKQVNAFDLWKEAGVAHKLDLRLGSAVDSLGKLLETEGENSFDFAFIDANKSDYDCYYEFSLKLVRPGGLIAIDNTLWGGQVLNMDDQTPDTKAIRALNDKIADDSRVTISFLTMADGVTLCFKN